MENEPLWEQNVLHMLHYYVFCEGSAVYNFLNK